MKREKRKPMLNLMYQRKKVGLTQIELSRKVDGNDELIYSYESGARVPNAEMLSKIAKALNCKIDEIVD